MSQEIKVDLHFHPNLNGFLSSDRSKAMRILLNCLEYDLTALIITEHTYKDPVNSFRSLYQIQQELIKVNPEKYDKLKNIFLFPGIEYMCTEGGEIVLFHDQVDHHGNAFMYEIMKKRHPLLLKPYGLTLMEVIDIAAHYKLSIYAPHPFETKTGSIKIFGKACSTKSFRYRISQIVSNRNLGISVHNGAFDSVADVLKELGVVVPFFEQITSTPPILLDEANSRFNSGGSDAHVPELIGSGIKINLFGELTRKNVYLSILLNKEKKVFKPKRGFFGRIKRLFAGFKQLGVTSREVITEKKIIKQIEKEKKELLEAYVRAWEKGLPIKDIIKLKHLFPGKSFMLSLSKLQIKRLKIAMEKKKLERKNKILLEAA